MDPATVKRLLEVLRKAEEPLTIGDVAERMGVSRPTASKYVDICEAMDLIHSSRFATARQVSLKERAGRKRGSGGGG